MCCRRHWLYLLLFCLPLAGACAQVSPEETHGGFAEWLSAFKEEARQSGISNEIFDDAFANVEPLERVLELDRKQPESTLTFERYLANALPPVRIERANEKMSEHGPLLREIGEKYGVPPRYIVALWGMETDFGDNTGSFSVIESLATLAYDGRRSDFFRKELLNALRILQEGHITASAMDGSWAGAMGQCQFMPSSFLNFAEDHDGDGRRDIWQTQEDVFASIANYLSKSGWNAEEGWGREVDLPAGFDTSLADIAQARPLAEWRRLGVRKPGGGDLPGGDRQASLIFPSDRERQQAYLVYSNYKVLLKWNRSRYFATAVGMLADQIGEGQ